MHPWLALFILNVTVAFVSVSAKVKVKLTKRDVMQTYEGVEEKLHTFLTSALDGGEW
jgi:hypothetical protein